MNREFVTLQDGTKAEVFEMGLCEVYHIILRKNQLYRFVILGDCEKCKEIASHYDEEGKAI
jgi:hypothetical protein